MLANGGVNTRHSAAKLIGLQLSTGARHASLRFAI
jgi:hypothetical protein